MRAKIAIIGGGFSAGFARLACIDHGVAPQQITMYTDRILPPPEGAFYLHSAPGSLDGMDQHSISIRGVGTKIGYLQKQWGVVKKEWKSSFPESPTVNRGYAPKYIHDQLWKDVEFTMLKSYLKDFELSEMLYEHSYDFIFHSFPTEVSIIAQNKYLVKFMIADHSSLEHIIKDLEELEQTIISNGNGILYNGIHTHSWVRASQLFGKIHVEYPPPVHPDSPALPVKFYRDLHPDTPVWTYREDPVIIPIGRLATWDRKKLSNHVYKDVQTILQEEW